MPEYQLVPCPFCDADGDDLSVEQAGVGKVNIGTMSHVFCGDCETEGPLCSDETDAMRAWNKRPAHAEVQQEAALLRDDTSRLHVRLAVAESTSTKAQDAHDRLLAEGKTTRGMAAANAEWQAEVVQLREQVGRLQAQLALRTTLEDDDD